MSRTAPYCKVRKLILRPATLFQDQQPYFQLATLFQDQ